MTIAQQLIAGYRSTHTEQRMERLAMDVIRLAGQPGAYAGASMNHTEDLITRARRGDEEAFRLIFER